MNKRIYGLDLLRILSMLGIIGLHIVNNGGFLDAASSASQLVIARFFANICYCSVNTFAMLTGYLYIEKKKIRSSNLIDLLTVVAFYCIVILSGFLCVMPTVFQNSRSLIIFSLFPPAKGRYWFITSYVLVFMMIPYMNALIRALTKQQFGRMLLILFVLLSVVSTFGIKDYFRTMDGYSPAWLIFCYLIGAYIKLYYNEHTPKRVANSFLVFFGSVVFVTVFWFAVKNNSIASHFYLYQYTSPFMVINAVCLVLAFSRISISNEKMQKVLLRLSNSAFGVYIIHSHILVFDLLLADAFSEAGKRGTLGYCMVLIANLLGIYLVCWILEEIRMLIFQIFRIKKFTNRLGEKVDRFLHWC